MVSTESSAGKGKQNIEPEDALIKKLEEWLHTVSNANTEIYFS